MRDHRRVISGSGGADAHAGADAGGESDGDAVFAAERPRLIGLAYRLLGSVTDAEDIVQEAWIRWHGRRPGPDRAARRLVDDGRQPDRRRPPAAPRNGLGPTTSDRGCRSR